MPLSRSTRVWITVLFALLLIHGVPKPVRAQSGSDDPAILPDKASSPLLMSEEANTSAAFEPRAFIIAPGFRPSASTSGATNTEAMPEPLASGIAPAFLARPKEQRTPGRALWGISVAALAAASIMDAHSSWGKQEANSMLQGSHGRFGTKGIAIKAGVNSAWIVSQVLALRKGGSHRTYAILNFAVASVFAATSYHNYSVPR